MRNPSSIDFSLILPSRSRVSSLRRMLDSFYSRASHPEKLEAVVMADFDDPTMICFGQYISEQFQGRVIFGQRSTKMIRDYNNYGSQCARGKYLFQLNDDFEMVTDHWDEIIANAIESFLADKRDRVAYVQIDDSTHTNWGREDEWGCCCPVLTVEAVDIMNAFMPNEIDMWGADIYLWRIFRRVNELYPRILRALDVKVLHHCRHNQSTPPDELALRVEQISQCRWLNWEQESEYVNKLVSSIQLRN